MHRITSKIKAVLGFEDLFDEADSLKPVLLKKESYSFKSQKNPVQA